MRKPDSFFLGAPKCGTTALAHYLSGHPQIMVSDPKEPNFFGGSLKTGTRASSTDEYLKTYFAGLEESNRLVAVDASVWHLYSEDAVKGILDFQPNARFLVVIRNPVEMAYSYFSMLAFMGWEDQENIRAAWSEQRVRKNGINIPRGFPKSWDPRILLYKDVCSLGTQLSRAYNQIERDRVHLIFSGDMKIDTRAIYLRALDFLGVSDDGRTSFPTINSGRNSRFELLATIQRNDIVRKIAYLTKRTLGLPSFGIGRLDIRMQKEEREFLAREFQEEITLLENLTKRDLTHWRKNI